MCAFVCLCTWLISAVDHLVGRVFTQSLPLVLDGHIKRIGRQNSKCYHSLLGPPANRTHCFHTSSLSITQSRSLYTCCTPVRLLRVGSSLGCEKGWGLFICLYVFLCLIRRAVSISVRVCFRIRVPACSCYKWARE